MISARQPESIYQQRFTNIIYRQTLMAASTSCDIYIIHNLAATDSKAEETQKGQNNNQHFENKGGMLASVKYLNVTTYRVEVC